MWLSILRGLWPYYFVQDISILRGRNHENITREKIVCCWIAIWGLRSAWIKKLKKKELFDPSTPKAWSRDPTAHKFFMRNIFVTLTHRYHIYRCLTVANTSVPYWFHQIFINIPPSVQIHSWRQQNILHYALEKWELLTGLECHDTIYSLFSAWILCKSFTFSVLITRLKTYVVPYLRLWIMTIWKIK